MLKKDIKVGGLYAAKVNGVVVTVRVDSYSDKSGLYYVTSLKTGRNTTFHSAAKFRREVKQTKVGTNVKDADGYQMLNTKDKATMAGYFGEEPDPLRPNVHDEGEARAQEDEVKPQVYRVVVDNKYTYETALNLKVGDKVVLPSWSEGRFTGKVTALTSTYKGACKSVIGLAPQEDNDQEDEDRPDPQPSVAAQNAVPSSAARTSLAARLGGKKSDGPTPQHIIVMARAGTGKTSTGEEGIKAIRGVPARFEPSPQQEVIWEAMKQSSGCGSIGFTAFGKDIAEEIKRRLAASGLDKQGCEGLTTHSLGFRAVRSAFRLQSGLNSTNQYVVQDHLAEILAKDSRQLKKDQPVMVNAVEDLVGLCKQTLSESTPEALADLADHYGVDLNGSAGQVFEMVPQILERCKNPEGRGQVDFNDMVWLPVVLNLPVTKYDLMICDESQDLNRARQELVKKAGKRIMLVGDDRQAIFGFAGADAESMKRMGADLSQHGVVTHPLTVTRRCGKAIVEEAKKYVPDFEAHESNPDGQILSALYPTYKDTASGKTITRPDDKTYLPLLKDGDRVLCRCNAPLVSQCFKLIRMGRKANILGRDVGQGLLKLVEKLRADSILVLLRKLAEWVEMEVGKEIAKRNPSENRMTAIHDRATCLECFCDGAQTVADVVAKIRGIFTDDNTKPGILLSSIHKSKGLESDNVYYLQGGGCMGPPLEKLQDWEVQQEENLRYVAITRARYTLTYVR